MSKNELVCVSIAWYYCMHAENVLQCSATVQQKLLLIVIATKEA